MKWLYILAGLALYVKILVMPNPDLDIPDLSFVQAVVDDSGVPNALAGIIFRNRLYDTIFEVVVFTIAIMGVRFCWRMSSPLKRCIDLQMNPRLSLPG